MTYTRIDEIYLYKYNYLVLCIDKKYTVKKKGMCVVIFSLNYNLFKGFSTWFQFNLLSYHLKYEL